MKFSITEPDAPVGTPLGLTIAECTPARQIDLTAALIDDTGETWRAEACLAADAGGCVDPATAPSLSGTYTGVDPIGLSWSMRPENAGSRLQDLLYGNAKGGLTPDLGPLAPLEISLTARDPSTGLEATERVIRRRLPRNVRQSGLPAPLYGLLFEPERPNGGGVVVLGGSEGGVNPGRAALLAASGFTTVCLAYFDYPGRPRAARDLELSYFHTCLEWLRRRPGIGKVGLIGVSRGSEVAQLAAVKWPEAVDALVLWVPSHLVHNEIDLTGGKDFMEPEGAMWADEGTPVPGIAFTDRDRAENAALKADFATLKGRRYRSVYEHAWRQPEAEKFRIPIEEFGGPVLAVAGADDALWPADIGAQRIVEAAHKANKDSLLRVHPSAGHLIGTPGEPRPYPYVMHWADGYMGIENGLCAYGGTPEGAAIAASQSWSDKVAFLNEHLCQ